MRRTRKLEQLLKLVRSGSGKDGIYSLAATAGPPYRRVHDQVRRLEAAGFVHLEGASSGSRARVRVLPVDQVGTPALQFNRAWSRPLGGVDVETTIAQVLARPTFHDLLACVKHCGSGRVRAIYERMLGSMQLDPGAAGESARMLNNIEIGRARACGLH